MKKFIFAILIIFSFTTVSAFEDEVYTVPWSESSVYVIFNSSSNLYALTSENVNSKIIYFSDSIWLKDNIRAWEYINGAWKSKVVDLNCSPLNGQYCRYNETDKYKFSLNNVISSNKDINPYNAYSTILFPIALWELQVTELQRAMETAELSIMTDLSTTLLVSLAVFSVILAMYYLPRLVRLASR